MRMWNINPRQMCNKHLLGEHVEMHMFAGSIKKKKNIAGYIKKDLVEVHNIKNRHDKLAMEMQTRGMNHKSKLNTFKSWRAGKVNVKKNMRELKKRCSECKIINS